MADPYFKDFFDANDVRTKLFKWETNRFHGGLMYDKFRFRSDLTGDLVLMRKAEMVLIEAESLAEQNDLAGTISKLDELRSCQRSRYAKLKRLNKKRAC